jgi:mono/diheme cytochrome c family protein
MKLRIRYLLMACALAPWFFLGCTGNRREEQPLRPAVSEADARLVRGQSVFMEKCDRCHPGGEAGLGPSLKSGLVSRYLVKFQARNGMGVMPAFDHDEISDADLDDVVAFLKALRANG